MSNYVKGKNAIASLVIDTVAYPIFCAKTWELSYDQDELEVTNINSGASREYIPAMNAATFGATGITQLDNSAGQVSINYLLQQAIRRQIHLLRIVQTDDDGGVLQIEFNAFVTNTTLSKSTGSYSQSSLSMRITGALTFSDVITPPSEPICEMQDPLALTLLEGETIVSDPLLIGDNVVTLMVFREGLEYKPVTGSPVNRTYRHDKDTGEIIFDATDPAPLDQGVEVVYKLNP